MDKKELSNLLDKYNAGKASPADIRRVEAFAEGIESGDENFTFGSEFEKARIKEDLRKMIQVPETSSRPVWWSIAASIIVLLGVASMFWLGSPHMIQVQTAMGETQIIELEDGTIVQMNAGSTLSYPEVFDESNRTIEFSGEAFFKVAKDKNRPFSVQTSDVTTTVLGTEFNIHAYQADSFVQISLMEGSVEVKANDERQVIAPMQAAVYIANDDHMAVQAFDSSEVVAWTKGDVVLNRMTFKKLCGFVKLKYNVNLKLDDHTMNEYTISGSFNDPSLELLLASVSSAKGLQFKKLDELNYLIYEAK